jgi:hypothetical protein
VIQEPRAHVARRRSPQPWHERDDQAAAVRRQRPERHAGALELGIDGIVMFVAFVPFFSLQEAGRLLGETRFLNVLSRRPPAR